MPEQANRRAEVAVVIPCYNAAAYLARALESVFAQTYRDYRVYVIDDGSRDDTRSLLRSYGKRIVSVSQIHAGQAAARNCGIRMSNSPHIAFLDADDEWLPGKLQRQIEVFQNNPRVGMLYSDCSTSGPGESSTSYFARTGIPVSGRVFERILLEGCAIYTPTVMLRRECLDNVGLFDESLAVAEDYNLWLRIAARWDVGVIPDVLAIRHITPGSLSLSTSKHHATVAAITAFEHAMRRDLQPQQLQALRIAIAKRYSAYASLLLAEGESRSSRQQLAQSWRYGARDWRTLAKFGLSFLPRQIFTSLRKLRKKSNMPTSAATPCHPEQAGVAQRGT